MDGDDVGNLHHIKQCSYTRHDVFSKTRCGSNDRVIILSQSGHQNCDRLSKLTSERGIFGTKHLRDA